MISELVAVLVHARRQLAPSQPTPTALPAAPRFAIGSSVPSLDSVRKWADCGETVCDEASSSHDTPNLLPFHVTIGAVARVEPSETAYDVTEHGASSSSSPLPEPGPGLLNP